MTELNGAQRKYLRGLAHGMKPVVLVGEKGLTPRLVKSLDEALEIHELVKVKFNDHKDEKKEIAARFQKETGSELVGQIGHNAIFFRQNKDPEKQKIKVPRKGSS